MYSVNHCIIHASQLSICICSLNRPSVTNLTLGTTGGMATTTVFTEVVAWLQLLSVFYRSSVAMGYISTGMGYRFNVLFVSLMGLCLH